MASPQPQNSDCNCNSNYFVNHMNCESMGLVPNVDGICMFANSDSTPPFYVSPVDMASGRLEPAMIDRVNRPPNFDPILPF